MGAQNQSVSGPWRESPRGQFTVDKPAIRVVGSQPDSCKFNNEVGKALQVDELSNEALFESSHLPPFNMFSSEDLCASLERGKEIAKKNISLYTFKNKVITIIDNK